MYHLGRFQPEKDIMKVTVENLEIILEHMQMEYVEGISVLTEPRKFNGSFGIAP